MEEEPTDNELFKRSYSKPYYIDNKQANPNSNQDALAFTETAPRPIAPRYWHTNIDNTPDKQPRSDRRNDRTPYWRVSSPTPKNHSRYQKDNTVYQKINTSKEFPKHPINDNTKPKEEKEVQQPLPVQLSIFQSMPQDVKNSIEIIEHEIEGNVVDLESSDDDEVIEVALPPKPTITIESSSEDELPCVPEISPSRSNTKLVPEKSNDRDVSASPVPSVVSSLSDEFIRSDCIALNISSRRPANHSFDFSLHGADLLGQSTPKKKKKKKTKEATPTPTPVVVDVTPERSVPSKEEYFATPKSKAKNKKQKTKSYAVSEQSVPNADVYDSDSNQSTVETIKLYPNPYAVTDKSLPCIDVYESDSNLSETVKAVDKSKLPENTNNDDSSDTSPIKILEETPKISKRNSIAIEDSIDLTTNNDIFDDSDIHENIVMGNVTGFTESEDYGDIVPSPPQNEVKLGSTKVPAILYENLDFDNLKGKDTVCKSRRYSLTTLRAEMEKFYNESWGGEDFNHREIQKYMSRDKSLWAIDPKDKIPSMNRRKTCHYCNRPGHRDDMCRMKPAVCYMCGSPGHIEPRCPRKICVNCGSPNNMYSTMCRNCCTWGRITCAECGQSGHPASHCPDIWRRYHNTIDFTNQLERNQFYKKHYQLFCSGCTRRGHLVHTCRISLPFSGLPINSPYVHVYKPVYGAVENQENQQNMSNNQRNNAPPPWKNFQDSTISSATTQFRNDRNKRQSKSPTAHETHVNKKRNTTMPETPEIQRNTKNLHNAPQRKLSQSKEQSATENNDEVSKETDKNIDVNATENPQAEPEKAPDFIPIGSTNHDKKGQIIQDNEVSDTSDVVTSARIYVTNEIINQLKTKEGQDWLKETTEKHNVTVENAEVHSFLSIKGKFTDQEAFQAALRDWARGEPNKETVKSGNEGESENDQSESCNNIPNLKSKVLRKLKKALDLLKENLGEPNAIFKELNFLQNRHEQLLKQKVINPKQLTGSRDRINEMLKKLNMVLLGQAGLAGGSRHVSELHNLQKILINLRVKIVPIDLRKKIEKNYYHVFTAEPRRDYETLLKSYNSSKAIQQLQKNTKVQPIKVGFKKRKFHGVLAPNNDEPAPPKVVEEKRDVVPTKSAISARKPQVAQTINMLLSYRKRLMQARPNDSTLKKTKVDLARKLHSSIASLSKSKSYTVSWKSLKKMHKVQKQAQTFLNLNSI